MRIARFLTSLAALASLSASSAAATSLFSTKPHPVIVWHGLGDSAYADTMTHFAKSLRNTFPGMYVHLVAVGDDLTGDQKAGFFGNVNEQVAQVCEQLAAVPELQDGADAIGFSQGGQFLRAYVERCNKPKIRNLVTFGSQHQGIADLPVCKPGDLFCKLAEATLRTGINTEYAQSHIVTAQYFKNPRTEASYQGYLEHNHFLTDINNELAINETYKKNLASLDNFVMIVFDKDLTVVPKESGWFSTYPVANSSDAEKYGPEEIVPVYKSKIFLEDRIGLRKLTNRGAMILDVCNGGHMQVDAECQRKVFGRYIGHPVSLIPAPVRHAWGFLCWNLLLVHISPQPAMIQLAFGMGIYIVVFLMAKWIRSLIRRTHALLVQPKEGQIAIP